jgi:hypothetical protein
MNVIYLGRLSTTVHQGLFPLESFSFENTFFLYVHFLWNKTKGIQQGLDVFVNLLLNFFFACIFCVQKAVNGTWSVLDWKYINLLHILYMLLHSKSFPVLYWQTVECLTTLIYLVFLEGFGSYCSIYKCM